MKNEDVQIVIIDDDLSEIHPVVIYLKRDYSNIQLIRTTKEGVEYVENNRDKNLIIILDYRFNNGRDGDWALEKIREFSSLVPVILFTAEYPREKFKKFINLKTIAFANKGDYEDVAAKVKKIVEQNAITGEAEIINHPDLKPLLNQVKEMTEPYIEKSEDKWETSIVGMLEAYIKIRNKDPRNHSYDIRFKGKNYQLEELLSEVQKDSSLGKEFNEKVHKLTIQSLLKREVRLEAILFIDDLIKEKSPIMAKLSKLNVPIEIARTPQEGVNYVVSNEDKIMIIVLDYRFENSEYSGNWVINEIRKHSKIIPIILMSAAAEDINEYDEFINNDTFAIAEQGKYEDLEAKISDAIEYWELKVAGAYGEWITDKKEEEKEKPYLAIAGKRTFSLNDALKATFQQTPAGQKIIKDKLMSTLDLLIRKKIEIND